MKVSKPVYSDEQLYTYEICVPCPECGGHGTIETKIPVDNSEGKDYGIQEKVCENCMATGDHYYFERYGSKEEAWEDYPHATSIERNKYA